MSFQRKHRKHGILCAFVATALAWGYLLLFTPNVFAFQLFGCKWPTVNINVSYTALDSKHLTAYNGAKADWDSNTILVLGSGSPTNVQVTSSNYGNTGWSGIADGSTTCPPAGQYGGGKQIRINKYYTDSFSANLLKSTITHELGHSFGLAHSGDDKTPCNSVVIMNHYGGRHQDCAVWTTQIDDRNGINFNYQ